MVRNTMQREGVEAATVGRQNDSRDRNTNNEGRETPHGRGMGAGNVKPK